MCASRSVGARLAPSASATSCPCDHVSISRAVMNERSFIGGPNQGSRVCGSACFSAATLRARAARHHSRV